MDWSLAAKLLCQELDSRVARKQASERPENGSEKLTAGGSVSWPAKASDAETPTDRPQPSETVASRLTVRFGRNARWEDGMRSRSAWGGAKVSSSGTSPFCAQVAANDDRPGHAASSNDWRMA